MDVFAPATPDSVDDERYEALFDTMYQLRSAIAKKRKDNDNAPGTAIHDPISRSGGQLTPTALPRPCRSRSLRQSIR